MEIFGIPIQAFLGQLLLGLVNGSFYAMLSLGLAVIFGLLGIVNFAHGALYMIGAYVAWVGLNTFGINYWLALVLAPIVVGALGVVIERTLLKHLYKIDPIYGLLLTFGLALIAEGVFREQFGVSGQQYEVPALLQGATNLGFMILPNYRGWVVFASLAVCLTTWFVIEKTPLGALLRAGIGAAVGVVVTVAISVPCRRGRPVSREERAPLSRRSRCSTPPDRTPWSALRRDRAPGRSGWSRGWSPCRRSRPRRIRR